MKKFMKIFTLVGLLFSLSIGIIYADMKDIPEGRQIQLQYGYASAKDTTSSSGYTYKTNGTCKNNQAVVSVYVRDANGNSLAQSSCYGLTSTYAKWISKVSVRHSHAASSIIPK